MNKKFFLKFSFVCFLFLLCFGFAIKARMLVPVSTTPLTQKTIIIDAGHGLPDNGASSKSGTYESEINLKIAKKLKKLLKKGKVNVIMTREDENSLSTSQTNNKRDDLQKRVNIRDTSDADIFLSIHLNHFSQPQYSGAQVFYSAGNPESEMLANTIQKNLIELVDPENTRSSKASGDIFVLKNSSIPCVLVECGFLSNEREAKLLEDDSYQNRIAWAIYSGICEYYENL